ncbi:MAG: T9SS type A sorting domain-containing protein [Cyclobacteriaceae bacterium]
MNKNFTVLLLFVFALTEVWAQTCTVTGSYTFANIGTALCAEGGTVDIPGSTKVILDGSLTTTGNNQSLTGYSIEIADGGSINVDHNGAEIGGSIKVKDGGFLGLEGGLTLPSGSSLGIEDGGLVDSGATGSDRLTIGSTVVLKGNGSCTEANGEADSSPPYCSSNGISGPTGFDETGENPTVLPIVLGRFNAIAMQKSVELEWETISEENFDFFSIERSDDGENFYEIGTVPGHGDSNVRIQYSFEDKAPLFGISYYRLNAIDYDGSFEKFKAIAVEYIPEDLQLSMYPNPGNGSGLTVLLGLPIEARLKKVSVFELGGNLLFEKPLHTGINEITPEQRLTGGFYFAKFQIDNYQFTRKLIIK